MARKNQPNLEFISQEQAFCAACASAIPRENIDAKLIPYKPGDRIVKQHVVAYCDFCGVAYETERQLTGGTWQILGAVTAVKSRARTLAIAKGLESKRSA